MRTGAKLSAAFEAVLLMLFAPALLAAGQAPGPNLNRYGQTIDLRVELSSESEASFRGDWHHRILFANHGGATLLIYRGMSPGWGIFYRVTALQGRPVRPAEPLYISPPPPPPQSELMYTSL